MARNPDLDYFYEQTRAQIEHEDILINHRLTWLFTLNGFLLTAYAFSLSAEATAGAKNNCIDFSNRINHIRNCLAVVGACSSLVLFLGILAATFSMRALANQCEKLLKNKKDGGKHPQVIGNKLWGMSGGLLPTWILPIIFGFIWIELRLNFYMDLWILVKFLFNWVWLVLADRLANLWVN